MDNGAYGTNIRRCPEGFVCPHCRCSPREGGRCVPHLAPSIILGASRKCHFFAWPESFEFVRQGPFVSSGLFWRCEGLLDPLSLRPLDRHVLLVVGECLWVRRTLWARWPLLLSFAAGDWQEAEEAAEKTHLVGWILVMVLVEEVVVVLVLLVVVVVCFGLRKVSVELGTELRVKSALCYEEEERRRSEAGGGGHIYACRMTKSPHKLMRSKYGVWIEVAPLASRRAWMISVILPHSSQPIKRTTNFDTAYLDYRTPVRGKTSTIGMLATSRIRLCVYGKRQDTS